MLNHRDESLVTGLPQESVKIQCYQFSPWIKNESVTLKINRPWPSLTPVCSTQKKKKKKKRVYARSMLIPYIGELEQWYSSIGLL